ncbi:nuclear RNA export factor 5-like [Lagenorhynchus albirostris]|uniref:nuclear RNA export factor 5-like n=1 Tax=Lagenorhynchus albirostris TaxID=27610 RepID=UPI0028EBEE97|nr:nuclear RNA export factor 5-like [Lagenorhynchus albirostris]
MQNGARFLVQEASTASALMDVSYKIRDEESRKIPVFVSPSAVPYSVRDKLKPEEMEQLKLTLSKRFDVSQQALDLQRLRLDPGTADSSNSRAGEGRGVFLEGDLGMVTWGGAGAGPTPHSAILFPPLSFLKTWWAVILIYF